MSLLLAHVTQTRALVATDTAAQHGRAPQLMHTSKMGIFPHLHAVVACNGNVDLHVAIGYQFAVLTGGLDAFFADPLPVIAQAAHRYAQQVGGMMREQQAVAVVGWSPKAEAVVGVYAERTTFAGGFKVKGLEGMLVCPGWPGYEHKDRDTDAALIEAARHQVAYVREAVPECPIGGRLTIAEIDRHGIHTRLVPLQ